MAAPLRSYYYTVDHNGYLFLTSTRMRNFTSAYKDIAFLDFFNQRIRRLVIDPNSSTEGDMKAKKEGFDWISPCGREMNYIKPDEMVTPVVYQTLDRGSSTPANPHHKRNTTTDEQSIGGNDPDRLSYGGSLHTAFDPSSLRLGAKNGYLYHPSPIPSTRRNPSPTSSPYGNYLLLRSSLVLESFSKSLHVNDDGETGTFEWNEREWEIQRLKEEDLV
jgi:hypothetical protein